MSEQRDICAPECHGTPIDDPIADPTAIPRRPFPERSTHGKLRAIIEEYADHQSVRCGWPAGYGQWKDGNCACGLTWVLREAGLPVEWAGGPPEN